MNLIKLAASLMLFTGIAKASTLQQLDLYTSSAQYRVTGRIGVAASTTTPTSLTTLMDGVIGISSVKPIATSSNITGAYYFGNGSNLTGIVIGSTTYLADGTSLALTGATFSAKSSSVTLQGNTFNAANKLVKLDGTAKLPAIDASALTGIDKLPATGGSMTGSLIMEPTSISTGQIIFQGLYPHSIQFNNQSATSSQEFLGEIDFKAGGGIYQRIIGYGNAHATYPGELQIGGNSMGTTSRVRLMGGASFSPDVFVSSYNSVGINTASPNALYKLDVNGDARATNFYGALVGNVSSATYAVTTSSDTYWNAKQAAGNYITSLTGGVTASGPGASAATVVTNANLTGPITSVGNATTIVGPVPVATIDLSTVTTAIGLRVLKSGDTMTGQLTLNGSSLTVTGNAALQGATVLSSASIGGMWISTITCANTYRWASDGAGNMTCVPPSVQVTKEYFLTSFSTDTATNFTLMLTTPPVEAISTKTFTVSNGASLVVSTYITLSGYPNLTALPSGAWELHYRADSNRTGHISSSVNIYHVGGTWNNLFTFPATYINSSNATDWTAETVVHSSAILSTDRLMMIRTFTCDTNPSCTINFYKGNGYYADLDAPGIAATQAVFVPNSGAVVDVDLNNHAISNMSTLGVNNTITASTITLTGKVVSPRMSLNTPAIAISSNSDVTTGGGIILSSNVYIVGFSSATKYYGDGSSLTGVASSFNFGSTNTYTGSQTFASSVTVIGEAGFKTYVETISSDTVSSSTWNIEWSSGSIYWLTLSSNTTLTFSGAVSGKSLTFLISQNAGGTHTVTWPNMTWGSSTGNAPTLKTASGSLDVVTVLYKDSAYLGFYSASGGGDAYLASTQTWTAPNTFTATGTFNSNQILGTVANSNSLLTVYTHDSGTRINQGIYMVDAPSSMGSMIGPGGTDGLAVNGSGVATGWSGYYMNYYSSGNLYVGNGGGKLQVGAYIAAPNQVLDVNGGSMIRGQEIITGSSTIQGNAFSVGGSSFTVSAGLVYFPPLSMATIASTKPAAAGGYCACSNCATPYILCKSSGTGVGAIVYSSDTTKACTK